MDLFYLFVAVVVVFWTWFNFVRRQKSGRLPPPGPFSYPIVGNILQLGQFPHRSLAKLAQTYGPLLSLRLGSIYTVVVSSPELTKEILLKQDKACAGRLVPVAMKVHDHHKHSVGYLPAAGPEWRKLRKLGHENLFSVARLEGGRRLRQEKVRNLRDYLQRCCDSGRVVNIGEAALSTALNLISAALFSEDLTDFDSGNAGEFSTLFKGFIRCMAPNVVDFFPLLKSFDPQGIRKEAEFHIGKLLEISEAIINRRMRFREEHPDAPKKTDFLEALLDFEQGNEYRLSVIEISHFFLDLLLAGSDTTATTIEWVMTELLLSPDKLSKVREELKTVVGDEDKDFDESDFSQLPYFQAMIKEVFRYYPPGPLLFPRETEYEMEVNGYTIPKGTQLMFNVWAIGRDPSRWSNPDIFEPERFLGNEIDFKGNHFELLPFGAGRRVCPGMPLANRILNMSVATMIHNFDWELESTAKVENAEKFGISLHKAVPLRATPIKRSQP